MNLPFSKYASPIFAQRKSNGRLRLLVDLRKINNLISQDYVNNNHPIRTLSNAGQHMAGTKRLCKLDCFQAYHCLQMADYQSIPMLIFIFASRTFAYRRLAQGLSLSLSALSSFMREYLDKAIKADQCAQYVDDIGNSGSTSKQSSNASEKQASNSRWLNVILGSIRSTSCSHIPAIQHYNA